MENRAQALLNLSPELMVVQEINCDRPDGEEPIQWPDVPVFHRAVRTPTRFHPINCLRHGRHGPYRIQSSSFARNLSCGEGPLPG